MYNMVTVLTMCHAKLLQSCPTLCNPMDHIAHQAPLSMGFSRQEHSSGLPCPPPGDLPNPGIKPESPVAPALAGRFVITSTTWEAPQSTISFVQSLQSCPTLCNPKYYSTPGFPVLHHLPEFAQVHVHWVGDAILPSHPLPPSSFAFSLSQHRGLFQWVGSSHQVAKVLELHL